VIDGREQRHRGLGHRRGQRLRDDRRIGDLLPELGDHQLALAIVERAKQRWRHREARVDAELDALDREVLLVAGHLIELIDEEVVARDRRIEPRAPDVHFEARWRGLSHHDWGDVVVMLVVRATQLAVPATLFCILGG
jgi:hypothetical protein